MDFTTDNKFGICPSSSQNGPPPPSGHSPPEPTWAPRQCAIVPPYESEYGAWSADIERLKQSVESESFRSALREEAKVLWRVMEQSETPRSLLGNSSLLSCGTLLDGRVRGASELLNHLSHGCRPATAKPLQRSQIRNLFGDGIRYNLAKFVAVERFTHHRLRVGMPIVSKGDDTKPLADIALTWLASSQYANSNACKAVALLMGLSLLPTATATPVERSVPESVPVFGEDTVFDYVLYALMACYILLVWWQQELVGKKAKNYAFAIMVFLAVLWPALVRDEFSAGIHRTAFKLWAVTIAHFVAQDCVDSKDAKLHLIKFLAMSVLFEIVGTASEIFSATSFLTALPPALAAAAVVNWALPHADGPRQGLGEDDSHEMSDYDDHVGAFEAPSHPSAHVRATHNDDSITGSHISRQDINSNRDPFPHPHRFIVEEDSDLGSLRKDGQPSNQRL